MSLLSPVTVAAPAAICGSWVPLAAFWFSGLFPGPSPTMSFLRCCPPLACFPQLLRPCYSSFSVSSFLLTHYGQDFLPGLVGEGVLRRLLLFFLPPSPEKAHCCQPLSLSRTFHSSSRDPPPPAPENKIIFSAVYPCGPLKLLLLPGNGSLRCLFPSVLLSGARLSWICY